MNTIEKAYSIMSSKTGKPYIDKENRCYVFTEESEANAFSENLPVFVDGPRFYEIKELQSQCYAAGATVLVVRMEGKETSFPLAEKLATPDYYNATLNRLIAHIKQSKSREYLPLLRDERYIVPAKVETEDNTVKILYAVAKNQNDDLVYLAFSDLNEYYLWNSIVDGWQPLEVGYETLRRIGYHNGFLLNICGNKLFFKRKWFEYVDTLPRKEEQDDHQQNQSRHWSFN